MYRIGFDIGMTKTECAVLDSEHRVVYRRRQETGNVFDAVSQLYDNAVATFVGEHTIGIGFPNKTNRSGIVVNCSIEPLNGVNIERHFSDLLDHSVKIANDSHCFALAEARLGAGKNYNRVFGAIIGSGVGGGLVVDGELVTGHNGVVGEWGHTNLDPSNGIKCRCGLTGCVETWLAGRWRPTTDETYYDRFGQAMANVINTLDPECIVLGGGLSNQAEFYTLGVVAVDKYMLYPEHSIAIVKAELGDSAGVIGAALL